MEALDDHLVRSNDRTHIIKGKRTKRQRSLSPINTTTTTTTATAAAVVVPAAVAASSSSISGGIRVGFVDDENYASSSGEIQVSTEEEEDMANCLIMLARGEIRFSKKKKEKKKSDLNSNSNLNSRKFDEIVTTNPSNKAGFYVYECKTCNRSFPSFQALGGHRASHKKPKSALTTPEEKPKSPSLNNEEKTETNSITSRASNNTNTTHTNKTNKIHECSICGSEFGSGQALGGHMRRHRAATVNTTPTATTTTSVNYNNTQSENKPILTLDLNLPAPEDDMSESKFQFGSTTTTTAPTTQSGLIFSAPALIDCHY